MNDQPLNVDTNKLLWAFDFCIDAGLQTKALCTNHELQERALPGAIPTRRLLTCCASRLTSSTQ